MVIDVLPSDVEAARDRLVAGWPALQPKLSAMMADGARLACFHARSGWAERVNPTEYQLLALDAGGIPGARDALELIRTFDFVALTFWPSFLGPGVLGLPWCVVRESAAFLVFNTGDDRRTRGVPFLRAAPSLSLIGGAS